VDAYLNMLKGSPRRYARERNGALEGKTGSDEDMPIPDSVIRFSVGVR